MSFVVVNVILYFILFLIYRKNFKEHILGFSLIVVYFISAFFSFLYFKDTQSQWNLTLLPFLYLFVVFVISLQPFLKRDFSVVSFDFTPNKYYSIFLIGIVICAVIDLLYSYQSGLSVVISGDYYSAYTQDDKTSVLVVNGFHRFAKLTKGYLSIPCVLIASKYISSPLKKYKYLGYLSLLILIASACFGAFIVASRGLIFKAIITIGTGLLFTWTSLDKKTKLIIIYCSVGFLLFYSLYSYAIADARFSIGNKYSASDSILAYLGQAMLHFNNGVMNSIESLMHGDYLLGSNPNKYLNGLDPVIGTNIGSGFITYVGNWYVDFGFLGTLLIAILLSYFFMHKKLNDLADVYLFCFYFSFLANGVLVHGIGYIISFIMAFVVYCLFKLFIKYYG